MTNPEDFNDSNDGLDEEWFTQMAYEAMQAAPSDEIIEDERISIDTIRGFVELLKSKGVKITPAVEKMLKSEQDNRTPLFTGQYMFLEELSEAEISLCDALLSIDAATVYSSAHRNVVDELAIEARNDSIVSFIEAASDGLFSPIDTANFIRCVNQTLEGSLPPIENVEALELAATESILRKDRVRNEIQERKDNVALLESKLRKEIGFNDNLNLFARKVYNIALLASIRNIQDLSDSSSTVLKDLVDAASELGQTFGINKQAVVDICASYTLELSEKQKRR